MSTIQITGYSSITVIPILSLIEKAILMKEIDKISEIQTVDSSLGKVSRIRFDIKDTAETYQLAQQVKQLLK